MSATVRRNKNYSKMVILIFIQFDIQVIEVIFTLLVPLQPKYYFLYNIQGVCYGNSWPLCTCEKFWFIFCMKNN